MVFLPIADSNPRVWIRYHYVTAALVAACALVFLVEAAMGEEGVVYASYRLGLIPAVLWGGRELSPDLYLVPAPLTLLTSTFLHGGWFHLIGNMLFLWTFGDNIEDSMGHRRFVLFYLLCGALSGLTHAALAAGSPVPTIGASGAVAGVLGAYLVLHPRVRVWGLFLIPFPLRFPSYMVLGGWIAMEVLNAVFFADPKTDTVAVWAHIGGFAAGAGLIRFFKFDHVPLFDRSPEGMPTIRGLTLPSWRRGPWGKGDDR